MLSVDGRVLAQQKMDHSIPFLMALDESLDIGMDTRTGVDEGYKLPFKFTGTINTVTYKIGPEQLSVAEQEEMQRAVAAAHDTPAAIAALREAVRLAPGFAAARAALAEATEEAGSG